LENIKKYTILKPDIGDGNIEDFSKFNIIDEEKIIKELHARFKKGKIYVIN
jgi:hypothetical protein